jgi:hypothetical protein
MGTDRWSFRFALVSLITLAALDLVCGLPGLVSFVLIPLSWIIYGITFLVILAMAVYCFVKNRPRRGCSVLLALLLPVLLWRPIAWAADVVHIGITTGFGGGQLGNSKPSDGDFVVYDWSVGFAGGPNRFLIHDASDEIALPMAMHTRPSSSEDGFGEECAGKVRRLISHYYVCSF